MDAITNKQSNYLSTLDSLEIRAADFLSKIPSLPSHIKVLSLDCFDTILFRRAFIPTDVFYDLQHKPHFQAHGLTAFLRVFMEGRARSINMTTKDMMEVKLSDIYLAGFPNLTAEEIEALSNDELEAEMETCFAFPAMVEIMRAAKKRGLEIIVVSDTYFNEAQLRKLLSHTLPQDAYTAIDRVFCSSDYGSTKSQDLFKHVLKSLPHSPEAILHIGDNPHADYTASKNHEMGSLHLYHHNKNITNLLRMQEVAACFFDGNIRDQRGYSSPYRAILAQTHLDLKKPEMQIGYYSLGQIMYSFVHFIHEEVENLQRIGKKTKVLFLMRDAYLPHLVSEAMNGSPIGPKVRISRFAAIASSFRSGKDIQRYLTSSLKSLELASLCKQILLPKHLSEPIVKQANKAKNPHVKFMELVKKPEIVKFIINASKKYRQRMLKHLEREADIKPGDTLVFVDLGYTGTAQIELTPVFKEMGIDVVGRYLISLQTPGWKENRKGLLDSSWCDHRTMQTIVSYIALLEKLCTSNDPSVVDYKEDGTPIFSKSKIDDKQGMKNESIHQACIQFAKEATAFFKENNFKFTSEMRRDVALGELGRLLFLPTESELDYFLSFQFDLNMGTDELIRLFDINSGLEGMRKRGLFFMERTMKSFRTNYPAELRSAGAELVLTLMAGHRYGLALTPDDMSYRKEKLDLLVANNGQIFETQIDAKYTYDGCFSAIVPLGKGQMQVAILFGKQYKWLEINNIDIISMDALYQLNESLETMDGTGFTATEHLSNRGGKLFECNNQNAFLAYIPNLNKEFQLNPSLNYVLRITFRPTVKLKDLQPA